MSNSRPPAAHSTIASKNGIAYVITYSSGGIGLGHTAMLIVDPDSGETIHRSFYPSSHMGAAWFHNMTHGFFPVPGFNTKNIACDAKYYRNAPISILQIDNLDFGRMRKQDEEFCGKLEADHHLFSLRYNGPFNFFNAAFRYAGGAYLAQEALKKQSAIHPLISSDPFSETMMSTNDSVSYRVTIGNCTEAVLQLLRAGGCELKQSPIKKMATWFFALGHIPETMQETLKQNGAKEMINNPEKLPEVLQETIVLGKKYRENEHCNIAEETVVMERNEDLKKKSPF